MLDYRDRAILNFFFYSGDRLSTACRLKVPDFHQDGDEATLPLDAGVDIIKVKELLGQRHVTTTQIYDKRRRSTSESVSHLLAI